MAISLKHQEAFDSFVKELDFIQQYTKWELPTVLRRRLNEYQFAVPTPSQFDKSLDDSIKREVVFTVFRSLNLDEIPLPLLRSLRKAVIDGVQLSDYPAMCLLMTVLENSIHNCLKPLGTPEIRSEGDEALDIIYKDNPHNKGFGYDEKEVQSSIILEIEKDSKDTLNFFIPLAILKSFFSDIKWCEYLPGIGYYDAPDLEQVKKVTADFVNYDSLSESYPLEMYYDFQPEYKNKYGGMLRIHITNVKYHLNSDSQRIQTEESLVERFTTSLKRVFGRRK